MDETELELSTPQMPLLGYTVIANLKGIEVEHTELLSLLTPLGFADFLPALVEPRTALRRAMRDWIKELAQSSNPLIGDDEDDVVTRPLVREIPSKKKLAKKQTGEARKKKGDPMPSDPSDWLAFALVAENINLNLWGLDYLTNLRVFYNRKTHELSLTTSSTGQTFSTGQVMTFREENLLLSLTPHYRRYETLHLAGDLSRMAQDVIGSMNSQQLRPNGGAYFVPYDQRDKLTRLKELIEEKLPPPPGGENTSYLLNLPIVDSKNAKSQLATSAHSAFMQELVTLSKDMERFILQAQHGRIKRENMAKRLVEYQEMKAKVELYKQVLGMRQDEILKGLAELEGKARMLLETAWFVSERQSAESEDEAEDAS